MGRVRSLTIALTAVLAATLGLASTASARDPGRWLLTGASSIPIDYWQGLASDPSDSHLFFIGPFQGLWETTPQLKQTAGLDAGDSEGAHAKCWLQPHRRPHLAERRTRPRRAPNGVLQAERQPLQHLRQGRLRHRRPPQARIPLLRPARPEVHPQGDVGRDIAERQADLDLVGQRPHRLPRQPGHRGERRPVRPGAQARQDAHRTRSRRPASPAPSSGMATCSSPASRTTTTTCGRSTRRPATAS